MPFAALIPTLTIATLAQFNPPLINDPGLQLHNQQHNHAISPSMQFSPPIAAPSLSRPTQPARRWRCYRNLNNQVFCVEE